MSKIDFNKFFSCGPGYSVELSKNLHNPFWKDCLNSWSKFCNVCKVESVNHILCSPIWFNNNLNRGQNLYINNWFKKGIKQVSDLFDIEGNMYQFDALKETYGINGTFLDYQSLIHKIPNNWKNIIINNRQVCIQTKYNVTCNIYVKYLLKDKRGCRTFYDQLIQVDQIIRQEKWMNEVEYINDQELNTYNSVIKDFNEVVLKEFQYKLTNRILVTKSFLHRIRKIEDNLCSYCKKEPETIIHLFADCDKVKEFWQSLQMWLLQNINIRINIDTKCILFSYQGKSKLESYLLAVAKHYIYKNKFSDKQLNINSFISVLKVKFQCERFIANINNKMSKFLSKWTPFYNYFNNNQEQTNNNNNNNNNNNTLENN